LNVAHYSNRRAVVKDLSVAFRPLVRVVPLMGRPVRFGFGAGATLIESPAHRHRTRARKL